MQYISTMQKWKGITTATKLKKKKANPAMFRKACVGNVTTLVTSHREKQRHTMRTEHGSAIGETKFQLSDSDLVAGSWLYTTVFKMACGLLCIITHTHRNTLNTMPCMALGI